MFAVELTFPGDLRHPAYNTSHFGLGVIKDFDVMSIPPEISAEATQEWYDIPE